MSLKVLSGSPDSRWDAELETAGGTVFHSTGWARYVAAGRSNVVPCFLRLEDDRGRTRGLALAFRATSPSRVLAPFSRSLWLDALPVVVGEDAEMFLGEFLHHLKAFAQSSSDVELCVGSFASPGGAAAFTQNGFEIAHRLEFVCPLDISEEGLWSALGSKQRNLVRKAIRLGVTVHELAGCQALWELHCLQGASAARITRRGGPDLSFVSDPATDPIRVLLETRLGRVLAARLQGPYVSAGLFTCFNGLVYYTSAGHSEEGLRSQAPTLLLWEAMKRFRTEGARTFNLGGCAGDAVDEHSPEHGVYVYKRSLAAKCVQCASGRVILRRRVYEIVKRLRRVRMGVLRNA